MDEHTVRISTDGRDVATTAVRPYRWPNRRADDPSLSCASFTCGQGQKCTHVPVDVRARWIETRAAALTDIESGFACDRVACIVGSLLSLSFRTYPPGWSCQATDCWEEKICRIAWTRSFGLMLRCFATGFNHRADAPVFSGSAIDAATPINGIAAIGVSTRCKRQVPQFKPTSVAERRRALGMA